MTLLHAHGVCFQHATQADPLFESLSFTLSAGDHVALIGPNGAGKSTLMALIAGSLEPTSGTLQHFGTTASMPQRFHAEPGDTVLDVALCGDTALDAVRREMRRLETALDDPETAERYTQAMEQYGDLDGYGREIAAQSVLEGLGLPESLHGLPVTSLSSGQRSRVALARLLLTPADLYLLDEPSNHLDLDGQRWLAEYLERLEAAFLLVTHDRLLLQHGIQKVMELRRGRLISHAGSYTEFVQARAASESQAMQHYDAEQRRAKAAERAAAQRAALAARVAKAPPPGQFSGASKPFYEAKAGRVLRTARILKDRAAVASSVSKPFVETGIGRLTFQHTTPASGLALAARDLTCGYGDTPVITDVTFDLHHGERLAILGPNGSGKTTLLKTLAGLLPPLGGEVVRGHATRTAIQHQERLPGQESDSPLTMGLQLCPDEHWVRTILACLKLGPEHIQRPLGTLSPGEQGKAELARMLLSGANLLILDEPTNHLDLMTREALETVLEGFPGAILLVSHDAAFVDAVADAVIDVGTAD